MISKLFENLATFIAIAIFGINIVIIFIRAHYNMAFFEILYDKHRKLIKKIPYYNKDYLSRNRSKILFRTFKRFFTLEIFFNKKSKEYFNRWFRMDLINKTKDAKLIYQAKITIMWWVLSDFLKGILLVYMILLAISVIIIEVI